jgi:hypothetical protein
MTIEAAKVSGDTDLRSEIMSALRQSEADLDAESDPIEGTAPVTEEASTVSEATESQGAERPRDEHGRFVKKVSTDQSETEVKQEAQQPEPIQLPKSWSADQKERFHALPRELQEYLVNRENEREKFVSQKSDRAARLEKQFVEPIYRELAPFEQKLAAQQKHPIEFVSEVLRGQAMLDRNPVQAIAALAESYGLKIKIEGQQDVPAAQIDPNYLALYRELQGIKSFVDEQQQAQLDNHMKSLEQEVEAFGVEKDAKGALVRPHFEAVWQDMLPHVQTFRRINPELSNKQVLEKAYKHALLENEAIQAAEAQRVEAKRIEDAKAKSAQARRAGASLNGGSPGGGLNTTVPDDLRSQLKAAFRGEL